MEPTLIIHGGTGGKNPDVLSRMAFSLERILDACYKKLLDGDALNAAVEAVRLMEDDELFNAGTGSKLQKDGKARLSASVMEGSSQKFAGVVNLEDIKNPVMVARLLLNEKYRVLSGAGAQEFALSRGFKKESVVTPAALEAWKKKTTASDTVGACALDAKGRLASATSTGGIGGETPGRVSDSCTPAGNFANGLCAVSATGVGEEILDECLAAKIAAHVEEGMTPKDALEKVFEGVKKRKRAMGAIALNSAGESAWDTTSPVLAFALRKGRTTTLFKI